MCDVKMVEVPVNWKKEGQPDYSELGVDMPIELERGVFCIDFDRICRFNESIREGETTVSLPDGAFGVAMTYKDFKRIYQQVTGKTILTIQSHNPLPSNSL